MQASRTIQIKARILLTIIVMNTLSLPISQALTGGPSQPEVQSFEPIGTSEMVDLSTGTFNYNIPLLDVGGYPLNIHYNAGVTPDQEASCVGLGWNINCGTITRNMRGLPDDFNGDKVSNELTMKPNKTWGASGSLTFELFGKELLNKVPPAGASGKLGLQAGLYYNNYKGIGLEFGISPSLKSAEKSLSKHLIGGLGINGNFNVNSQSGVSASGSIKPSLSYISKIDKTKNSAVKTYDFGIEGGVNYNSRQGLMATTLGASLSRREYDKNVSKYVNEHSSSLGNTTFSYATPIYLPSSNMPMQNLSLTLRTKLPVPLMGADPGLNVTGYYSKQELAQQRQSSKSYGTIYLQNRQGDTSLLDFNREKDGPVTKHIPNLAVLIPGQDIYAVSGQGVGGSYEMKRSDIGVFHDKKSIVFSGSATLSLDAGPGQAFKLGADIVAVGVEAKTGKWQDGAISQLDFKKPTAAENLYEPAYFKAAGDMTAESDSMFFINTGSFNPVDLRIDIKDPGGTKFDIETKAIFREGVNIKDLKPLERTFSNTLTRAKRERRNQNISWLTAGEAIFVGLNKTILDYTPYPANISPVTAFVSPSITPIYRMGDNNYRKSHHISEVTCLREDGVRYVYGVPAYNVEQRDYTFSVDKVNGRDCQRGLVSYTTAIEKSIKNKSGRDNFYSMEKTPAYAHSWLLTSVISADYSDVDQIEGPSVGDNGNYTRINYSKISNAGNYKWRLPYGNNQTTPQAQFNAGLLSDLEDNKGNIVYGEKEIWNIQSVESKLYVAEFYYSPRTDALGVAGVDGAQGDALKKLDSIVLYSRPERLEKGWGAEPIKIVHFKYDYSLCSGIPNSNTSQGKLTLKGVFFTYGRSNKGRFSPYKFEYGGVASLNPSYDQKAYSRWGFYQPSGIPVGDCAAVANAVTSDEMPYVIQDLALQNGYASAWNLSKITLPSGGIIKVEYESHDYAYVQDKPAMEMMEIKGVSRSSAFTAGANTLFSNTVTDKDPNLFLFFEVKGQNLDNTNAAKIIERDYIKDIKNGWLYFRCMVDLKKTSTTGEHKEFVFGYSRVESWGLADSQIGAQTQLCYVKLKKVCLRDAEKTNCGIQADANPISKAGWQFTRLNLPDLLYSVDLGTLPPEKMNGVKGFTSVAESFLDLAKQLNPELILFPTRYMRDNDYAQKLQLNKSWIRLYSPKGKKLAGGSRVKSITIEDNWKEITSNTVDDIGKYGQSFSYTTEQDLGQGTANKRIISSGVASYEPMIGNEENPFRQPEYYNEAYLLAPDNSYYQETPFGEGFFPSPQIVYGKVTVTNTRFNTDGTTQNNEICLSTGSTVSEYFTAKDYPTKTSRTDPQKIQSKTSPLLSILKFDSKHYLTTSQGFCVELNDMHGKPKAQWVFDDKNQRLSGVEYFYKNKQKALSSTNSIATSDSLDNKVRVIHRNGDVRFAEVGVNFQLASDSRESIHESRTRGVALNSDGFLAGIFPFLAVVPWPIWETERKRYRSSTITKVIQRIGLLEKMVVYDAASKIETDNLAYDAQTGEVLLTRTFNEFGDPIFNLKYPAHFAYKGMRQAGESVDALGGGQYYNNTALTYGYIDLNLVTPTNLYMPGDELILSRNGLMRERAWVLNVTNNPNRINVCNKKGSKLFTSLISGTVNIKTIRSGKRNLQSMPIQTITLTRNPIQKNATTNLESLAPFVSNTGVANNVLNASATEYADMWQYNCFLGCSVFDGQVINPFVNGSRGNWRPKRSLVYLAERKNNATTANNLTTDIRSDGEFNLYSNFWSNTGTTWSRIAESSISKTNGWTWTNTATKINQFGDNLESVDPLGRFSASLMGYRNTLPIAVASNAKYREIAFDNFEDYVANNSNDTVLCYKSSGRNLEWPLTISTKIDKTVAHSGNQSVKLLGSTNMSNTLLSESLPFYDPNNALDTCRDKFYKKIAVDSSSNVDNGCNCLDKLKLTKDSTYMLSAWIRFNDELSAMNSLSFLNLTTGPKIVVTITRAINVPAQISEFRPSGNVIEGWQRVVGVFKVPSDAVSFTAALMPDNSQAFDKPTYFDDIKIQPFLASMETYVYDFRTSRLMAKLDQEHYATFYEYDQSGMLERVKKETERGIMTIQESRMSNRKKATTW
jgi:hypothetical protein